MIKEDFIALWEETIGEWHVNTIDYLNEYIHNMPLAWGPNGFQNPDPGYWRMRSGEQKHITELDDSHLLNLLPFLEEHWGEDVREWPIYKELVKEILRRGLPNGKADWDS